MTLRDGERRVSFRWGGAERLIAAALVALGVVAVLGLVVAV